MTYLLRFIAWALPTRAAAAVFRALTWAAAKLPQNGVFWCYTIRGKDGSPYIRRLLLPRWGGQRPMLHWIQRPDEDRDMHNHPWAWAESRILLGGYAEDRLRPIPDHEVHGGMLRRETEIYRPGDINRLHAGSWHRISSIRPHTWTLITVGERVQEWGFRTPEGFVVWTEYLARKGLKVEAGKGTS